MSEAPSDHPLSRLDVGVAAVVLLLITIFVLPAVQQAREQARRSQSRNNLKQVGIALHNYHETFERFPPGGTFAADGTPHHSWTLFLQPYMSASPFYNTIDTNRPWDDAVNRDKFRAGHSDLEDPGLSPVKSPDGYPLIHYAPNQRLFYRNSSSQLGEIPSPAQTLLIADAFGEFARFGDPINWRDATIPFRTSQRSFGHVSDARRDGTHVLFVDGSVEFLSNTIDEEQYATLVGTGVPEPSKDLTALRPSTDPASGASSE